MVAAAADRAPGPPNVLVILFDDLGFAHLNCYGSTIETPNINRLAANGLRFTNFHVTPLCSPTRASLLTGRNHHTVGMRSISHFDSGYPHMRGAISRNAATMAEMLRDEDYATFALGKWHLAPMEETSQAGPFHEWPLQRGFDRYYGFLGGETDQFYPELVYDNHLIAPPKSPDEGYHLTEDLADHAIGFLRDHQSIYPGQPFFLYFAPGATHAPHQAPQAYLDKYRGRFDAGWDEVRQEVYARQQELGVIPDGTELAPRNPGVDAWDDMSENAQRFAIALQEAFAAFLDHTDAQIGRLIDYLEASDQLDNTIVLLLADNGASQEGGAQGALDEARFFMQRPGRHRRLAVAAQRHRRPEVVAQLSVGLGAGRQHPAALVQAEHARRRRPRPADRALAQRHRRTRRLPPTVPPRLGCAAHRAGDAGR